MAKRGALSDLNRDNWDEEENSEEAGTFTIASEEDLSKRKIIKARRRIAGEPQKSAGGAFKNFTGFSGFSSLNSKSSNNSPSELKPTGESGLSSFSGFGGLSSKPAADSDSIPAIKTGFAGFSSTNDSTTEEMKPAAKPSLAGFTGFAGLSSTTSKDVWSYQEKPWAKVNGNKEEKPADNDASNETYLESIKALNMSVSSWIQKHLNENPYVDLTPVFNDYRRHLANIESKVTPSKQSPDVKPLPSVTPPSSLSRTEQMSSKTLDFKTAKTKTKQEPNEEKIFAGLAASSTMQEEKPKEAKETAEDEPSDEPPKPKSVVTAEEGSKFSVRCKLFFNRNNAWSELGVGMLNIKDIDGKSQLLVRADTATGKILLNVFITSTTPVTRTGKNNVMLVSLPNPPLYSKPSEGDNSKPATYLIRVKTADSADELFKIVEGLKAN